MAERKGLWLPLYVDMEPLYEGFREGLVKAKTFFKKISAASRDIDLRFKVDTNAFQAAHDFISAATNDMQRLVEQQNLYSRVVQETEDALKKEVEQLAKAGELESAKSRFLEDKLLRAKNSLARYTMAIEQAQNATGKLSNDMTKQATAELEKQYRLESSIAGLYKDKGKQYENNSNKIVSQINIQVEALDKLKSAWSQELALNGPATKNAQLLSATMDEQIAKINELRKAYVDAQIAKAKLGQTSFDRTQVQYEYDLSKARLSGSNEEERSAKVQHLNAQLAEQKKRLQDLQTALAKQVAEDKNATGAIEQYNNAILKMKANINNTQAALNEETSALAKVNRELEERLTVIQKTLNYQKAQASVSGNKEKLAIAIDKANVDTVNAYRKAIRDLIRDIRDLENSGGNSATGISELKNRLRELVTEYRNAQGAGKEFGSSFSEWANETVNNAYIRIGRFSVSLRSLRAIIGENNQAFNAMKTMWNSALGSIDSAIAKTIKTASSWLSANPLLALSIGGVATAVVGLGYAISSVITDMRQMAKEGATLGHEIAKMKFQFQLDDDTASRWSDILGLAKTDMFSFAFQMQNMTSNLKKNNAAGKNAVKTLELYGESVRNANGELKNIDEMMEAVNRGFNKASAAGEGDLFMKNIFGRYGSAMTQIIKAREVYLRYEKEINAETRINIDLLDEVENTWKAVQNARDSTTKTVGTTFADSELRAAQREMEYERAKRMAWNVGEKEVSRLAKSWEDIKDKVAHVRNVIMVSSAYIARIAATVGRISTMKWTFVLEAIRDAKNLDEVIANVRKKLNEKDTVAGKGLLQTEKEKEETEARLKALKDYQRETDKLQMDAHNRTMANIEDEAKADFERLSEGITKREELEKVAEAVKARSEARIDEETKKTIEARKKIEEEIKRIDERRELNQLKKQEELAKKYQDQVKAAQQAQDEISQIFMTETEKRIHAINKQRDAWIKAGADEVEATRAAQKQIREARMSEAERTIRENAELAKKMRKLQESGDPNWKQNAEEWAYKRYVKQLAGSEKNLDFIKQNGLAMFRDIGSNVRERALGWAAGGEGANTVNNNQTNNTTVNFDRTMVIDQTMVSYLAQEVSKVIKESLDSKVGAIGQGNSFSAATGGAM